MLQKGQHTIYAYFWDIVNAQKAKDELDSMGYHHVQLDTLTSYGIHHDDDFFQPTLSRQEITGEEPVYSGETATYEAVLLSSTPENVMIGDGFYGGLAYLITVVTDNNGIFHAEEILKKNGGVFFGHEAGLYSWNVRNDQGEYQYDQNAIY